MLAGKFGLSRDWAIAAAKREEEAGDPDCTAGVPDYFDCLSRAMGLLAREPNAVFMGQAVAFPGTGMFRTLQDVPDEKKLELPVAEDMQLGLATGMALGGMLPICLYPRWNFLLLACSQLVLHLDKLAIYSHGDFKPKVIIRTAVATPEPLNPGIQHLGNFSHSFRDLLSMVQVVELTSARQIIPAYKAALDRPEPTLLVEFTDLYASR